MKKRTLSLLLMVSCITMTVTSCGKAGTNSKESGKQTVEDSQQATTGKEQSTNTVEAEPAEGADDSEFYCMQLKPDEEKTVDLGGDGNMDTLRVFMHEYEEVDPELQLLVNDKTIRVTEEWGENDGDVIFVHKSDGDYIIVDTVGDSWWGNVRLYAWNPEAGAFAKIDELEDRSLSGEWKDGTFEPQMDANTVCLNGCLDAFGTYGIEKNYSYGKEGFKSAEELYKIYGVGNEERTFNPLVLKQSLTFYDDNGNATKTLEAGQKVRPYEANDPTDSREGFKTEGNYMSFTTEDGEFLGHINYDLRKGGSGYCYHNREIYTPYVNGVDESELFEGITYCG